MALIVEDGTGRADADAYCSVAFADAHHAKRGNAAWAAADEAAKETAIVRATDFIETRWGHRFLGHPLSESQALLFPRRFVARGQFYDYSPLPDPLLWACAEYALRALAGPLEADPERDASGRELKSATDKIGPIEERKEYFEGGVAPSYPVADRQMKRLVRVGARAVR